MNNPLTTGCNMGAPPCKLAQTGLVVCSDVPPVGNERLTLLPTSFQSNSTPRAAEFFAGIGLVRMAFDQEGIRVVFANDIAPIKHRLYATNFDASDYVVADIRALHGADVPDIEIAHASFPCTDVSLAGNRAGLYGTESGTVWEFLRLLKEMDGRRPMAILMENVGGLSSSRGGDDLEAAIGRLNDLGYWCDLFVIDARRFLAQSRPRVFVVGSLNELRLASDWQPTELRPSWIGRFVDRYPHLRMQALPLALPVQVAPTLEDIVEQLSSNDERWWDHERLAHFIVSLSPLQAARLQLLKQSKRLVWRTAYRRTRDGRPVWEIRRDPISGCLRTARGGSSKQALVEAGAGEARVRWMTPREYARLQGAPNFQLDGVSENQALFALGDAVCVPVVAWIARQYLTPLVLGALRNETRQLAAATY